MVSLKRFNGTDWERIGIMPEHRALLTKVGTSEVFLSPTNITTADVLGVVGFSAALASGDIVNISGTYEAAS